MNSIFIKYQKLYNFIKRNITNETVGFSIEKTIAKISNIDYCNRPNTIYNEKLIKFLESNQNFCNKIKDLHITKYIGNNGNSTDFLANCNEYSVKTNINSSNKVCPQVIGQLPRNKFYQYFNLDKNIDIKKYIYENIDKILIEYHNNLYNKDIIYISFPKYSSNCYDYKFIVIPKKKLDKLFDREKIHFTKKLIEWNESNTLKYNNISIGEFQIHQNRNCIKFRFNITNYIKSEFDIII